MSVRHLIRSRHALSVHIPLVHIRSSRAVASRSLRAATAALIASAVVLGGFIAAPAALAATITQHPTVAKNVLTLMNQERAAHDLPALRMNSLLIQSAYNHNSFMANKNVMSHQCSGEASLGDRIDAVHYNWSTAGENIGWTSDLTSAGIYALQRYMYDEKAPNDGHRQIILSRSFVDVGISVITDSTHRKLWLTEDFGHLM